MTDTTRISDKEEPTDTTRKSDREESVDLFDMPPPDGDEEEVKEEKGLKINSKQILTRLRVLLSQIKAESNSYKLKNEIREIPYLLYQHNKITQKVYNSLFKSL